ncbi:hypothetical protein ACHAW5_003417 [Stephanodiscus triporus]|uniref:Uncharacterized protein n=1 Tax=Stephanodiscus triporus TaxID=2934178 RepID=A0ABD3NC62_9STRA
MKSSSLSSGQDYEKVVTELPRWDDRTMQYKDAKAWNCAVCTLLLWVALGKVEIMGRVRAVCISGTSASCLLVNRCTLDVTQRADGARHDPLIGKMLLWNKQRPLDLYEDGTCCEVMCHQSNYVSVSLIWEGLLIREGDCLTIPMGDWHNCLKLGCDVHIRAFPPWLRNILGEGGVGLSHPALALPTWVVSPGAQIGTISPTVASACRMQIRMIVVAGTTNSNALFFAAVGTDPEYGTAVTLLGSTLAIKMLSWTFVEDAKWGL